MRVMIFITRDCLLFPDKLSPLVYVDTRGLSLSDESVWLHTASYPERGGNSGED